ncbi:MAG: type II toxin-antitoxin system ParD family antitoxin [Gammaproteobacteria bacterium]|nr:type II toxin-antitoxin system ParD family antitoxin [Gammaproteobacteria bacterium]
MATMNISLPSPMRDWVKTQTQNGQYANSSDYVRDLIRKDQQRAEKLESLQQAITQGLQSGDPKEFDIDQFKKRMLKKLDHDNL